MAERPHRALQPHPSAAAGGRTTPSRIVLPRPANDNRTPPLHRAVRWATAAAAVLMIVLTAVWLTH